MIQPIFQTAGTLNGTRQSAESPTADRHPDWSPDTPDLDNETFGMHLLLDLRGCTKPIKQSTLAAWVKDLCQEIGMRRFGPPFIARFGLATEKTAGWTLLQPIETSNIGAHEVPLTRGMSVDVYSCKVFDPARAEAVCLQWFGGWVAHRSVLRRG